MLRGKVTIGFELADYDKNRAAKVTIDPGVVYSTYLGGSYSDVGQAIAVDSSGNAYVTGYTSSTDFPTTAGSFQTTLMGSKTNAFVTKLSGDGSGLVYSTYLGGNNIDYASSIAVDSSGSAYVTGEAESDDFPVTAGAFQTSLKGQSNAFITKLTADGSGLVYSTYLGGSNGDYGQGIAVDSTGSAYVTGAASSIDFPTTAGAFQTVTHANPGDNAFVSKLSPDGSALAYSSYLGGSNYDLAYGIAIDSAGNAYLTGWAWSADFPVTQGAFQPTLRANPSHQTTTSTITLNLGVNVLVQPVSPTASYVISGDLAAYTSIIFEYGDTGTQCASNTTFLAELYSDFFATIGALPGGVDLCAVSETDGQVVKLTVNPTGAGTETNAFVTKVNAAGSGLSYSTYLGGSYGDGGNAIAVDSAGSAYVTGFSDSPDFPITSGVLQPTYPGGTSAAFVTKLNSTGSALTYSTYFGGGNYWVEGDALAVDSTGFAYLAGRAAASGIPITACTYNATHNCDDGFVTKLRPDASGMTYSTYLGGTDGDCGGNGDRATSIAVDSSGNAYVTGAATSNDFPVTIGAFETSAVGGGDAYVTKLDLVPTATASIPTSAAFFSSSVGNATTKTITIKNTGPSPLFLQDVTSSSTVVFAVTGNTCPSTGLAPAASCTITVTFTPGVSGHNGAILTLTDNVGSCLNTSATDTVANIAPKGPSAGQIAALTASTTGTIPPSSFAHQEIALSGTGTATMTVAPTSYQFGSVKEGVKAVKAITVHNYQTRPVSLTLPPPFIGPNASDFKVTGGTCTSTLAKTSACLLDVTYTPSGVGTESATMTVTDSPDPLGPYMVSFTAPATVPETVSPLKLAFGNVYQSAPKT